MLQTGLFLQEKVSSCMKFAKISENSNRNFGKRKPLKRSNFKGFGWRSRWDSNPRAFWANGFQDRLVMTASIQLRISILFLFSSTFARKTCKKCKDCNYRKVCKTLCCKGLRWMSRSVIWNISRPPRYDHFDTSPCREIITEYQGTFNLTPFIDALVY